MSMMFGPVEEEENNEKKEKEKHIFCLLIPLRLL